MLVTRKGFCEVGLLDRDSLCMQKISTGHIGSNLLVESLLPRTSGSSTPQTSKCDKDSTKNDKGILQIPISLL